MTIVPVEGATSYKVYRGHDPIAFLKIPLPPEVGLLPHAQLVGSTSGLTFVDTNLLPLVLHYYAVTAVGPSGESAPSLSALFGGAVMSTAPPEAAIFGFADLHTHQFANLAFGGMFFHGAAFHPEGIEKALPWCDYVRPLNPFDWGYGVTPQGLPLPPFHPFLPLPVGVPIHGPDGLYDALGAAMEQGVGHLVGGYPEFNGWPRWSTKDHQQMYHDWLYRAYIGGLKLVVVHAVNNEVLCRLSNQRVGFGCKDMPAVDRQLAAAKELEAYIDGRYGGAGKGWYRIAYSGKQARHIINSGKLAVVLGIEVDDLFGCNSGCGEDYIRGELQKYYDMGVRHMYPVHVFDNAFGGAAMYNGIFNFGNRIATGHFYNGRDCSGQGYAYVFDISPKLVAAVVGLLTGPVGLILFGPLIPPTYAGSAHCNSQGLTPLGEFLIREMMARHMIVDIDHMSRLTTDRVFEIARELGYPLVSGHTGFIETSIGKGRAESLKTDEQVRQLRDLGGLIGPGLGHSKVDEVQQWGGKVRNDCGFSSKTWAQGYLYAVDRMEGGAVAFGSDFNGLAGAPAPRFGPQACNNDIRAPQQGGVAYPFQVHGKPNHLNRSTAGQKTFDYNVDGFAHIGLYPDFIADVKTIGLTDADLEPLFRSAEAYVTLWERIEGSTLPPCGPRSSSPASLHTGFSDAARSVIANSLPDDNYTLTGPPGSPWRDVCAEVVPDSGFPIGPWLPTTPQSKWIGLPTTSSDGPPGLYRYTIKVNVPQSVDPAALSIVGGWASDEQTVDVLVNGVSTSLSNANGFGLLTRFPPGAGAGRFVRGDNAVEFQVMNSGGPTGLRVEAALTPVYAFDSLNISTGFDQTSNQTILDGSEDDQYTSQIKRLTFPATVVEGAPTPPWVANSSSSKWIGVGGSASLLAPGSWRPSLHDDGDNRARSAGSGRCHNRGKLGGRRCHHRSPDQRRPDWPEPGRI